MLFLIDVSIGLAVVWVSERATHYLGENVLLFFHSLTCNGSELYLFDLIDDVIETYGIYVSVK